MKTKNTVRVLPTAAIAAVCLLAASAPPAGAVGATAKPAVSPRFRPWTGNVPAPRLSGPALPRAVNEFIFTSGGGAGITFTIVGGVIVAPGHVLTGHLSGPEPPSPANDFNGCLHTHFHGTIDGVADPDPKGCGWGIVSPFSSGGGTLTKEHLGQTAKPTPKDSPLEPPGPDFGSGGTDVVSDFDREKWIADSHKLLEEFLDHWLIIIPGGLDTAQGLLNEIEKEMERMKTQPPSSKLPPIFEAPPPPLDAGAQSVRQVVSNADSQHADVPTLIARK